MISHTKPNIVEFIVSRESKESIKTITSETSLSGLNYAYKTTILDPTDLDAILLQARTLSNTYSTDDVSVNLMGGTKHWCAIFAIVFSHTPNAKLLFVDANNSIRTYGSDEHQSASFNLDTLFRLQGQRLKHYHAIDEYTEADFNTANGIERFRQNNYKTFNALLAVIDKKRSNRLANEKSGRFDGEKNDSYVEWTKATDDCINQTVAISFTNDHGKTNTKQYSSPHAIDIAFNSGWLEIKVAQMFAKFTKVNNVMFNCIFTDTIGNTSNEIDIIAVTDNKPVFIECKTSLYESKDIDKFHSVAQRCGGSQSKAIVVSYDKLKPAAIEKCRDYGILYIDCLKDVFASPDKDSLTSQIEISVDNFISTINK